MRRIPVKFGSRFVTQLDLGEVGTQARKRVPKPSSGVQDVGNAKGFVGDAEGFAVVVFGRGHQAPRIADLQHAMAKWSAASPVRWRAASRADNHVDRQRASIVLMRLDLLRCVGTGQVHSGDYCGASQRGIMENMTRNPAVMFGDAVVAARKARGWKQTDLAQAAGVGRATIQRLEGGNPKEPRNLNLHRTVALVLGWTPESVESIFAGGKPALAGSSSPAEQAPQSDLLEGLPDLARWALRDGRAIDTEVVSTSPEGDRGVVMVLKGPRRGASREELEEDIRRWEMLQLAFREIYSDKRPKGD
jgi:transcriptional regulator with XRE-family HTH domain